MATGVIPHTETRGTAITDTAATTVILGLIPRMTVLQKRLGRLTLDALQRRLKAFDTTGRFRNPLAV
jgi:hypothetical protein